MSEQHRDNEPSLSEALANPEAYNLSSEDVARIKCLQFRFKGWDIPQGAGKNFN